MEPGGQPQQQRLPFNPQQRRNHPQWQVVGDQGGRPRQGPRQPNQPPNQSANQPHHQTHPQNQTPIQTQSQHQNQAHNQAHNQSQNQRSDRSQYNRSFRRRDRDPREGFANPVSQPGSSQSSDSEAIDRPALGQHNAREIGEEQMRKVPAVNGTPKFEPAPKAEPSFTLEQKLHDYTRQRDELNQSIERLHAELAGRTEVERLEKQLEQVQVQFAEEQKHRKDLEAAYQASQENQAKLQNAVQGFEEQVQTSHVQLRERDAHIQQLGDQLNLKDQQLRDSQEENNETIWRKDNILREQENQLRVLRKEKDEAIAEGNARHQMIERQTSTIAGLERQLQEQSQKLEEKEEQLQAAQEAAWAKEEQLREGEKHWTAQMAEREAFHVRNGVALQDSLTHYWRELQGALQKLDEFKSFHEKMVRGLQEELQVAKRPSTGPAKPGPSDKGPPTKVPPPVGPAVPAAKQGPPHPGVASTQLLSGVTPSVPPTAQSPSHGTRAMQPIHPASKPQASQIALPPGSQPPAAPGQHQQGLLRRAVESQPSSVILNPTSNPAQTQKNPPAQQSSPPQFLKQPEPYRPPEISKPPVDTPPLLSQNVKPGEGPQAKLLTAEELVARLVQVIPGRAEEALGITTNLVNKFIPKIAPNHWKNYRKEHGTLREFLLTYPQTFCVTPDDKVYLTTEAQQKRSSPPSANSSGQAAPSSSPTPQEASRAAAPSAPGGPTTDSVAKGGSPPQFGTAVAVTPLAVQKQKQSQQQNGPRSVPGVSNARPVDPPAKGQNVKTNASNRGSMTGGPRGAPGQGNRSHGNGNAFSGGGSDIPGGSVSGGGARNGPRHVPNGNAPSADGASVNGPGVHSAANAGAARNAGAGRQLGSKSPSSNGPPSKALYVPKGSMGSAKDGEKAKS